MKTYTTPAIFTCFSFCLLAFFISGTFISSAFASDREKEKRWAEQISDSLLDGEAIYLSDGKIDFLAIDTQAEEPKETSIIIIHGIGIHPDWPTIIQPLRVQLAEEGWNTLSLQMPILSNDANIDDYKPLMKEAPERIDAGIRYLAKNGAKKVVIIAHSLGSLMTAQYLANKTLYQEDKSKTPIIAFIGIGMGKETAKSLNKIKLPILDLYGEKDLPAVISSATLRMRAAEGNKSYKQIKVSNANHFFEDQDDDLLKVVTEALMKYP